MRRVLIRVAYDGSAYHGWMQLDGVVTVAGRLMFSSDRQPSKAAWPMAVTVLGMITLVSWVGVDARHVHTQFGKAGAGHQTHISCSNN